MKRRRLLRPRVKVVYQTYKRSGGLDDLTLLSRLTHIEARLITQGMVYLLPPHIWIYLKLACILGPLQAETVDFKTIKIVSGSYIGAKSKVVSPKHRSLCTHNLGMNSSPKRWIEIIHAIRCMLCTPSTLPRLKHARHNAYVSACGLYRSYLKHFSIWSVQSSLPDHPKTQLARWQKSQNYQLSKKEPASSRDIVGIKQDSR